MVNMDEGKVKKKKRKKAGITAKAKKKTAVARAVIRKGSGRIHLNKINLENVMPLMVKRFIEEPLQLAGDVVKEVDIDVDINGGGTMGQAVAARAAIAKSLVGYTKDNKLKEKFLSYDRLLLVDDPRRKEAKKPLGTGARSKKQKSKR